MQKILTSTWRFIKSWIIPIGVALIFGLIVKNCFMSATVDGHSMDPTLHDGQFMIVSKKSKIKPLDIIVFNADHVDPKDTTNDIYIKRVIGMPGDKVVYMPNGDLKINDKVIPQTFLTESTRIGDTLSINNTYFKDGFTLEDLSQKSNWPTKMTSNVIPKDKYFVMGDNRAISNDSRYWGLVPKSKILGVAMHI